MVDHNIQMKKKTNGEWENLFPYTSAYNVIHSDGKTTDEKTTELRTDVDSKGDKGILENTVSELDSTKNKLDKTTGDLNTHISTDANDKEIINTMIYNNGSQNVTRVQDVKYIAHRGVSVIAPENTLPAFYKAGQMNYWGAECDVRLTSDNVWVLVHDDTVDRTTDGTGSVSNFTLAQIKELTVIEGENIGLYPDLKIPTLEEFLVLCRQTGLFPLIEIKESNAPQSAYQDLVNLIAKYGLTHRSGMISFDIDEMQAVRNINEHIHMFPILTPSTETIQRVKELGNATMNVSRGTLTEANIQEIHSNGLLVCGWTINNVADGNRYIERGLDFVITDALVNQWGEM